MENKQERIPPEVQERADRFFAYINKYGGDATEAIVQFVDVLAFTFDYFTAPASAKFHGAYPGGLFDHSEHVFMRMLQLNALLPESRRYSGESAFKVGMFHDLCKMFFYVPEKKNVKNPETGQWETKDGYSYDDKYPYGHGEKSVEILHRYKVPIDVYEALAIRWHMGPYKVNSDHGGAQEIIDVWKKFPHVPMILMAHLADGLATHVDENTEEVSLGGETKKIPNEMLIGSYDPGKINNERVKSLPNFLDGTPDRNMYVSLFQTYLYQREGMEKLLGYLCGNRSDFFEAPATQFNQYSSPGGNCRLSLCMFVWMARLADLLNWPIQMDSIAAISLLHGLGNINTYKAEKKRKKVDGEWVDNGWYISKDEELPWGDMGAKSTYMIQPYQTTFGKPLLTREEALAIRWVQGALTGADIKTCSDAFGKYPTCFLAHAAYLLASFFPL